jgi:hypothetical protein
MASSLGRVVSLPVGDTAGRAGAAVSRAASGINASVTRLTDEAAGVVDDWGRDPALVRNVIALARLRWDITVGGDQHLPRRKGALIVVNARRFALTPVFAAFAISEAADRPVRFVGRSDVAPLGALGRRLGGLLDHPDEVAGALAARELVVMGATNDNPVNGVGLVDHSLVGAAIATGTSVYPTAVTNSPIGRSARVEIGSASRSSRRRRGPLAELELADQVRLDIGLLLDETGRAAGGGSPLDWFPLSGLGGN